MPWLTVLKLRFAVLVFTWALTASGGESGGFAVIPGRRVHTQHCLLCILWNAAHYLVRRWQLPATTRSCTDQAEFCVAQPQGKLQFAAVDPCAGRCIGDGALATG